MNRWLNRRCFAIALAVSGILALGNGQAKASILDFFDSATFSAGLWTYTYHANLSGDQDAATGDFTTIYDLAGINPGSVTITPTVGTWGFTIQNTGITPSSVSPTDNPSIPNLTITNTGAKIAGTGSAQLLFSVSFTSTLAPGGGHDFASQAHLAGSSTLNSNISHNLSGPLIPVPEPVSILMLGLGLPAMGLAIRKKVRAV